MKKNTLLVIGLLAQNAVFAGSFYGGLNLGYQLLSNQRGGIANEFEFNNYVMTNDFTATSQGNGIIGGAFIGLEQPVNNKLFLALEASVETMHTPIKQYDNSSVSDNGIKQIQVIGGEVDASERVALGITAKPGLMVNDSSRLYANLGYVAGKFQGSDFYNVVLGSDLSVLSARTGAKWLNAFRYGVGAQMDCTQQLAVRVEVNQTDYPGLVSRPYYNMLNGEVVGGTIDFKLRTFAATMGVVWHFV